MIVAKPAGKLALTFSPGVCPAWARCNRVKVPCIMNQITKQILAYGNCEIVRFRGKAAYDKDMSPRTVPRSAATTRPGTQ
jgi:hypothetical protein